MATLYVTEFVKMQRMDGELASIALQPPVAEQTVSYTGTAGASSAFHATTKFIRVHTDGICSISVGADPTATTAMMRMVAGQTEYFGVSPGQKISAIVNT